MARDERDTANITPVQRRLIEAADRTEETDDPSYMHATLCQVSMPYRRVAERRFKHRNGHAVLEIEAGCVVDPTIADLVETPLPYGPKPRLVLNHINAEALRQCDRHVEVESSLRSFAKRILGYAPNGREMKAMRQHLTALSGATIRMGVFRNDGSAYQTQGTIISGLYLWEGNAEQKTLWPSEVVLSEDYWKSLSEHAVPLDPRHIGALQHSAMALDIYSWLAQRLFRVNQKDGEIVSWQALWGQFGTKYKKLYKFRQAFRIELKQVLSVYKEARVGEEIGDDGTPRGLRLEPSRPPVLPRKGG